MIDRAQYNPHGFIFLTELPSFRDDRQCQPTKNQCYFDRLELSFGHSESHTQRCISLSTNILDRPSRVRSIVEIVCRHSASGVCYVCCPLSHGDKDPYGHGRTLSGLDNFWRRRIGSIDRAVLARIFRTMQGKDRFGASRPMVPSLPRQSRVDDWPILLDFATGILGML